MEMGNVVPAPLFPYPPSNFNLGKNACMESQEVCTKVGSREGETCSYYFDVYGIFLAYFLFFQDCSFSSSLSLGIHLVSSQVLLSWSLMPSSLKLPFVVIFYLNSVSFVGFVYGFFKRFDFVIVYVMICL